MSDNQLNRRAALGTLASGMVAANAITATPAQANHHELKNNIKQAVCYWCYSRTNPDFDAFCKAVADMGLHGVDLVNEQDWPILKKHGLKCTMVPGVCSISDGLNDKGNHEEILANFKRLIKAAADNDFPNVICFSGNRRGMSDWEGLDNCTLVLKEAVKQAEDLGVTICMELLNSKVDHKDYMCDNSNWGVELCKRVESPRFKLLYDIYHMQIMEGDVIRTIRKNKEYYGHYHTGGNPGRNEIDETQELYYPAISEGIIGTEFDGYMAHEFVPKNEPLESLNAAVRLCDV